MKVPIRWIPSIAVMGIIFFFSSRTPDQLPHFGVLDILIDQSGHALGYAALGISYAYALPAEWTARRRFLLALGMAAAYALTDEYHQSFVPMRSPNLLDIMTDVLGAVIGLTLYWRYSNSKSRSVS